MIVVMKVLIIGFSLANVHYNMLKGITRVLLV